MDVVIDQYFLFTIADLYFLTFMHAYNSIRHTIDMFLSRRRGGAINPRNSTYMFAQQRNAYAHFWGTQGEKGYETIENMNNIC